MYTADRAINLQIIYDFQAAHTFKFLIITYNDFQNYFRKVLGLCYLYFVQIPKIYPFRSFLRLEVASGFQIK